MGGRGKAVWGADRWETSVRGCLSNYLKCSCDRNNRTRHCHTSWVERQQFIFLSRSSCLRKSRVNENRSDNAERCEISSVGIVLTSGVYPEEAVCSQTLLTPWKLILMFAARIPVRNYTSPPFVRFPSTVTTRIKEIPQCHNTVSHGQRLRSVCLQA